MIGWIKGLFKMREGRFEVYGDEGDKYRFKYVSANNKIMFYGEGYTRHSNVKRALKSMASQLKFNTAIRVVDFVAEETYFVDKYGVD